ncbi:coiled-coil domain-containing protein [Natronorubrum tibetense]|uniref:Uncharacterized protein n=1 Tax=Natronorubrum tibetense GA33 TaxID=1114856 RepID=L9W1S5_9EURY|nr:hypothetical protein [Natronorubrum tibetense]ELY42268.1 hypothetical protein C496_07713 [Natronorubrum tibetense GA33]
MSPENEPPSADESSDAVDGGVLESLLSELQSEATDADRAALRRALEVDDSAPAVDGTETDGPGADGSVSEESAATTLADLQAELEATREDLDVVRSDVEDLRATDDALRSRLESTLEPRLEEVSRRLGDLDSQQIDRRSEVSGLRTELEARLETHEASLEARTDEQSQRIDDLKARLEREVVLLRSELARQVGDVTDDLEALEESTPSDVEARIAALENDIEALETWRRSIVAHLE